jgi:hypothetical protein
MNSSLLLESGHNHPGNKIEGWEKLSATMVSLLVIGKTFRNLSHSSMPATKAVELAAYISLTYNPANPTILQILDAEITSALSRMIFGNHEQSHYRLLPKRSYLISRNTLLISTKQNGDESR